MTENIKDEKYLNLAEAKTNIMFKSILEIKKYNRFHFFSIENLISRLSVIETVRI